MLYIFVKELRNFGMSNTGTLFIQDQLDISNTIITLYLL